MKSKVWLSLEQRGEFLYTCTLIQRLIKSSSIPNSVDRLKCAKGALPPTLSTLLAQEPL